MMASTARNQSLITEIHPGAAGDALLLAILLVVPLLAISSAGAQTFTVLHKFTGGRDGAEPPAGVSVNAAGDVYGVTELGGSFNFGTLFKLDAAGKNTVLHNFLGGDGLWPVGGLTRDLAGNLYGTTLDGGTPEGGGCKHGCGAVFKRDKTGKVTVLYGFTGGADGGNPGQGVLRDRAGNLYGTTFFGGDLSCYAGMGCGVVFKLDKTGKETVLYAFTDHADGQMPVGLIRDNASNLYGTTYDGGASRKGVVFKLDKTGTLTLLHSFTGGSDSGNPKGLFLRDQAGNLYGTTYGAGAHDYGVVFKLNTGGKLSVLYSFTGGTDGRYPGTLIADKAGNFYGTTLGGGTGSGCYYGGCGTVFKLDTHRTETVLHSFTGADGQLPNGLTMDAAGNFYGTTFWGGKSGCGSYGCGVVFKLKP